MVTLPELWKGYRDAFAAVHDALTRAKDTAPPASTSALLQLCPYFANEAVPEAGALPSRSS